MAIGKTEEDGTFRLNDLARGTYSVTARASMYDSSGARKSVQVDGDTVVDLELPVRKVTGRVVEAGSGAPLADASVTATAQAPVIASARSASTDSSGTFSIEGLDAATWSVTASKRGFVFRPQTASITSSDAADVRLEGTRADSIGIHAVDGLLGFPLRSVFVHATRPGGGSAFRGSVPLDGDGRGEIPSVEPGSYTLVVRGGGYAPAILEGVAAPSPAVEVRLTPGGLLEIRSGNKTLEKGMARANLTGAGGAPYPVTDYSDGGGIVISGPLVRFEHVAPGSYTLTGAGGEKHPFTVAEGGLAVVTLP
jgi:hypothetical protein